MRRGHSIAEQYSRQLRRRFRMWPTWLPDGDVRVGDFGRIENGLFERQGRLDGALSGLAARRTRSTADQLFASDGVRQVAVGAAGASVDAPDAKAAARIEFGRELGILVALRDCHETLATDPLATASELDTLRKEDKWQDGYCLVTGVVRAKRALIAIGSKGGGTLELSATAPVSDLLTCLDGEVRISSEVSVSYRALITDCTPLFRLSKLARGGELVLRGGDSTAARLVELDPMAD